MDPQFSHHLDLGPVAGLPVELRTGHTRQLLPDLAPWRFGAVFVDLWGSQYAEVMACWTKG